MAATQAMLHYSSFVTAGILAGVSQAKKKKKSYPEFGQGAQRLWPDTMGCGGRPGR